MADDQTPSLQLPADLKITLVITQAIQIFSISPLSSSTTINIDGSPEFITRDSVAQWLRFNYSGYVDNLAKAGQLTIEQRALIKRKDDELFRFLASNPKGRSFMRAINNSAREDLLSETGIKEWDELQKELRKPGVSGRQKEAAVGSWFARRNSEGISSVPSTVRDDNEIKDVEIPPRNQSILEHSTRVFRGIETEVKARTGQDVSDEDPDLRLYNQLRLSNRYLKFQDKVEQVKETGKKVVRGAKEGRSWVDSSWYELRARNGERLSPEQEAQRLVNRIPNTRTFQKLGQRLRVSKKLAQRSYTRGLKGTSGWFDSTELEMRKRMGGKLSAAEDAKTLSSRIPQTRPIQKLQQRLRVNTKIAERRIGKLNNQINRQFPNPYKGTRLLGQKALPGNATPRLTSAANNLLRKPLEAGIRRAGTMIAQLAARGVAAASTSLAANPIFWIVVAIIIVVLLIILFFSQETASTRLRITLEGPAKATNGEEVEYTVRATYLGPGEADLQLFFEIGNLGRIYRGETEWDVRDDWAYEEAPKVRSGQTIERIFSIRWFKSDDETHLEVLGRLTNAPVPIIPGGSSSISILLPDPLPQAIPDWERIKNDIKKQVNQGDNVKIYQEAGTITNVPWEMLAALHYREGGNNPNQSLVGGRNIGQAEPDIKACVANTNPGEAKPLPGGGCGFTSLLDSAIYAGNFLKRKNGGATPTTFEQAVGTFAGYNGSGNANCGQSPYPNCAIDPLGRRVAYFVGDDHNYAMNWFDVNHNPMYVIYRYDGVKDPNPTPDDRPGAMTVIRALADPN